MNMTKMHQSVISGQLEVHADMRNKKSNNIVVLCEPKPPCPKLIMIEEK